MCFGIESARRPRKVELASLEMVPGRGVHNKGHRGRREHPEGEQSPREQRASGCGNTVVGNGLGHGARPRGWGLGSRQKTQVATQVFDAGCGLEAGRRHTSVSCPKGEDTRLTARRQRLRRRSAAVYEGKALEGVNGESGERREDGRELQSNRREARSETARTPWPGAGCNRPARLSEE